VELSNLNIKMDYVYPSEQILIVNSEALLSLY